MRLEDLSILFNQLPLKTMITSVKIFQNQKRNLRILCVPLKWGMLYCQQFDFIICIFTLNNKLFQNYLQDRKTFFLHNIPTYEMITEITNAGNRNPHDTTKTITMANRSEVPIKQNVSVICCSSIEKIQENSLSYWLCLISKKNILGTPLFKNNIQKIILQALAKSFKLLFDDQSTNTSFTTLK